MALVACLSCRDGLLASPLAALDGAEVVRGGATGPQCVLGHARPPPLFPSLRWPGDALSQPKFPASPTT